MPSNGTVTNHAVSLDSFIDDAAAAFGNEGYLTLTRGVGIACRPIGRITLPDIDDEAEEGEVLVITNPEMLLGKRNPTTHAAGTGKLAVFVPVGAIEGSTWDGETGRDGLSEPEPVAISIPANAGWPAPSGAGDAATGVKGIVADLGGDPAKLAAIFKWAYEENGGVLNFVLMYDNDGTDGGTMSLALNSREEIYYDPAAPIRVSFDWAYIVPGTPPSVACGLGTTAAIKDGDPVAVDANVTIDANLEDDLITAITVEITTGYDSGSDVLALPDGMASVESASFNAGVLTITPSGPGMTSAQATAAARAVTFGTDGDPGARVVTFTVENTDELTEDSTRNLYVQPEAAEYTPETYTAPAIVLGASNIAGFFRAAATRRVDLIIIGDSNMKQHGHTGHAQGMTIAWANALGCWGAGIAPAWGSGNWGSRSGEYKPGSAVGHASTFDGEADPPIDWSGFPEDFVEALLAPEFFRHMPDTADYLTNHDSGDGTPEYVLTSRHPMRWQGGLRYRARIYIPEEDAATQLYPNLMTGMADGHAAVVYPATPTGVLLPPTPGFHTFVWDVPAATMVSNASEGEAFRIGLVHYNNSHDIIGEVGILYQSIEDPTRHRGVRVSTFIDAGGLSTLYVAGLICGNPDALEWTGSEYENIPLPGLTDSALAEYFRFIAAGQVSSAGAQLAPVLCVQIIEGGNDANVGSSDPGPGSVVWTSGEGTGTLDTDNNTNTAQGYKNNTGAIIGRMRDVWTRVCGFSASNLYFLLGCYHVQPVEPQATFVGTTMIGAIEDLIAADNRVAAVDGYKLRTTAQFSSPYTVEFFIDDPDSGTQAVGDGEITYNNFRGWAAEGYDYVHLTHSGTGHDVNDTAHLHEHGYLDWGQRVVGALMESQLGQGGGLLGLVGRRSIRSAQEEEID